MSETVPDNWQIFMEQYPQFMKLHRKLGNQSWFSEGGYSFFVGHYHAGIYCQVYKGNWYNYGLNGVHFELALTAEELQTKMARLDLHIGHANLFDRLAFNERTVTKMHAIASDWPELMRFSKDNLSDRLALQVKFTKTQFAEQMSDAFGKLALLTPIIDEGLAGL